MYTIIVHINNSEPVKLDVDDLPNPMDTSIVGKNPRLKTDKEVEWVDEGVQVIYVPWHRINYIQVMPTGEEELDFPLLYRD